MPKRTNPFQQLAAIIHSRLGNGWNITESLFLTDSITGEMREVDVVAKATVGAYDIYISVECRDHKRPADVTWIESMAKKHESLSTSKLVLWSRSGFTKAAIAKATALKIDTVSQANAASTDWATLARTLSFVRDWRFVHDGVIYLAWDVLFFAPVLRKNMVNIECYIFSIQFTNIGLPEKVFRPVS